MNSPILLMDEPFGALDAITRARQQEMLLEIWQAGGALKKTVLFVTHDVDEALILAGRVIVLGVCRGMLPRIFPWIFRIRVRAGAQYPMSIFKHCVENCCRSWTSRSAASWRLHRNFRKEAEYEPQRI